MKIPVKRKPQQTNQLQARYLRDRLAAAHRERMSAIYAMKHDPEPARVKQARKIVESWSAAETKALDAIRKHRRAELDKAASKAREAILFLAPADALLAVQKFEQSK